MGERGPKPKPTNQLHSWRKNLRKDEPQPMGEPVKPPFVKGKAAKKWNELIEELQKLNVIGSCDSTVLARYCQLWGIYQDLIKDIIEEGFTFAGENKKGDEYVAANPKVNAFIKIAALLAKLEDCFGLTPAARAGLKVNGKVPEQSELEKLANQKGIKLA